MSLTETLSLLSLINADIPICHGSLYVLYFVMCTCGLSSGHGPLLNFIFVEHFPLHVSSCFNVDNAINLTKESLIFSAMKQLVSSTHLVSIFPLTFL